jgi:rod shape-determining protein MreD
MARCVIAGAVVTYLLAVFQATVGARLAIAGVAPDLLFVWAVCLGLLSGPRAGALAGFGAGLLEGALQQALLGALALGKAVSGCGAGLLATRMFRENCLVPAFAALLLTPLNDLIVLLSSANHGDHMLRAIVARSVYHALLAPLALPIIARARQALVGRQAEAR